MLRTVFEVTVALLAVWGLYCAIHVLIECFVLPRAYSVSVRLRRDEDAASLTARIAEARLALSGAAEMTVTLLCDEDMMPDPEVERIISAHSGHVFYIRPYDSER